jgi:Zn-dependent protease
MPKWLKFIIALLLLPVCFGATSTLVRLVAASGHADTVWVSMLAGAGCWLAVFALLPRPMLAYVYGHELTHVLWAWVFGS